jgi:hypothetical protein
MVMQGNEPVKKAEDCTAFATERMSWKQDYWRKSATLIPTRLRKSVQLRTALSVESFASAGFIRFCPGRYFAVAAVRDQPSKNLRLPLVGYSISH